MSTQPTEVGAHPQPHVLREYALIADGERGALIGPRGELAWMCVPNWHSAAVFAALIGGGGVYEVSPRDPWFVWGGSYEDGTLIWRNRWTTPDATIECREALAFPGEPGKVTVLRRVEQVEGDAPVQVHFAPRWDYGRRKPQELRLDEDGRWHAKLGGLHMRLTGLPTARADSDSALHATLRPGNGEHHDLVLEISEQPLGEPTDPVRMWQATEDSWAAEVPYFENTLAPGDVQHSYAVLRGLTSRSGAMVAAASTSLPERARGGGDFDYRFAWIRDMAYIGQGIAAHGAHPLLESARRFVSERILEDGPKLRPAYTVLGEELPEQQVLPLRGYPGGTDRIGNQVRDNFQLDSFGEALLLLAAADENGLLDTTGHRAITVAADVIAQQWQEPDTGVWELDRRHWTHSRLICVAGLRAVAKRESGERAAQWSELADRIMASTAQTGLHPSGRWQRSPEDPGVDAALLLPPLRGALPVDDPRSMATLQAVRTELSADGHVYRFRHDARKLSDSEGAFLLCGFMTAMAEHQAGLERAALRRFERNRAACGPPGLYTEEYDVVQRQLRGNIPQAFVHGMMVEAASKLANVRNANMEEQRHE